MKIISYRYTAINDFGEIKIGVVEKWDSSFKDNLEKMGYVVVDVKKEFKIKKRLNDKDIYLFSYEIYLMLNAGITIIDSLDLFAKEVKNKNISSIAMRLKEKLLKGKSLTVSMKEVDCFPIIYLSLINIGEISGTLVGVFKETYIYYKDRYERKTKIKSSLIYPIILIIALLFSIIIIIKVVVPNFIEIYSQFDAELPRSTIIFMGIIENSRKYTYTFVSFIGGIIITYKFIFKKRYGFNIDKFKFKLFKIYRMRQILELSKILSILVSSQIQFYRALIIAKDSVENKYLIEILDEGLVELKKGNSFFNYIYDKELFPDIFKRFIYIGEKTGNLDETLNSLYIYLKQKYDLVMETSSKLVEPVILICVAIFIGFIALVILAPMENLMDIIM